MPSTLSSAGANRSRVPEDCRSGETPEVGAAVESHRMECVANMSIVGTRNSRLGPANGYSYGRLPVSNLETRRRGVRQLQTDPLVRFNEEGKQMVGSDRGDQCLLFLSCRQISQSSLGIPQTHSRVNSGDYVRSKYPNIYFCAILFHASHSRPSVMEMVLLLTLRNATHLDHLRDP